MPAKHISTMVLISCFLIILSCEMPVIPDLDASPELTFTETDASLDIAGSVGAGDQAGNQAGEEAGTDLNPAGIMAGLMAGVMIAGDEVGISDASISGIIPVDPQACGEVICDANAVCISDANGLSCECEPRFEGSGESCTAQACPINASGAPICQCDEGYEGDLAYDISTRTWLGQCALVSNCELITIREDQFLSTEDVNFGEMIYQQCVIDEPSREHYRFSLSEGQVYAYYSASGTNSACASFNDHKIDVDSWAFNGGVLSDNHLFHVSNLIHTEGECTYDVLAVQIGPVLERVYLAPSGRACTEGQIMPISCGEGACRVDGEMRCEQGEWIEDCTPEAANTDPDSCDGLDTDCDGAVDEDFESNVSTCGIGACVSSGVVTCNQGRILDSCETLEAARNDASCDGLDQDCDGNIDENYTTQVISCGIGVCQAQGAVLCRDGREITECQVGLLQGNDADCDGVDQDCDGQADESYLGQNVSCGIGACRYEGSLRCRNGVVEELCTPNEPAENDTSCDGIDDDCDSRIDEDYESEVIFCGVGACYTSGRTSCVEGEILNECTAGAPTGTDTDCDGLDNDCDGRSDEGFVSVPMPCSGAGVYDCPVSAPLVCQNGQANFDCELALNGLSDASCDGIDDDCDGQLDESYISVEVSCGLGACTDTSMTRCIDGEISDRCLERSPTGDDSDCDGRDDDCDGNIDESFVAQAFTCGLGTCANTGISSCVEGTYTIDCTTQAVQNPNESSCDGLDNDCDGRIDEGYSSERTSCGNGVCITVGSSSCTDGIEAHNCVPLLPTGNDADCDGIDQDCDAISDESYPPVVDECGTGVCYNTANSSCVDGVVQNNCVPLPQQGNDSLCDGIDQDCDGRIDEAYVSVATSCTYGSVCVQPGMTACVNGSIQDVCDPPAFYTGSDNSCNNQDNDCDGRLDEGFVGGVYYCGNGACQGSGFRSCVNGQEGGGNCSPNPNNASSDNNCNGSDDDCDGRTDEHYGTRNTTCGRGVCARDGTKTCSNGSLNYNCSPGSPTGPDNTQDGRDNDCDGRVDEDAIPPETNCNGLDDDNDGSVDEGYGVQNSTCGNGACASTGVKTCVNGSVQDTCSPNVGNDNDCDQRDEDCDGRFDEHYNGGSTSCGTGACARNGSRICVNGSVTDSCVEGNPSNDNNNNGVDDDCDGRTDEHYVVSTPVGTKLVRCDFTGGLWYTTQQHSSGTIFWSAGLECYRSAGTMYDTDLAGYVFIDGNEDISGNCTNVCR